MKTNRATAFQSTEFGELLIFTDEGDQTPIKVTKHRIRILLASCVDAIEKYEKTR